VPEFKAKGQKVSRNVKAGSTSPHFFMNLNASLPMLSLLNATQVYFMPAMGLNLKL